MKKFMKSLLVATAVSLAGAAVAQAGSGSWTNQQAEPLIYQTNTYYGPTTVPALSGVPSGALISTVNLYFGYNASTSPLDPSYTLLGKFCVGGTTSNCATLNAANKVGTSDLNETFWSGKSATATWYFEVKAVSSTQKAFVSALNPSRQVQIGVNYTY
jgi:hypothetical protein